MRSPVGELLAALEAALRAFGVRWYLFGAQAVLLYGGARLTADVDVTVELGDRPTATLVAALATAGFALRIADVDDFVARTSVLPLVHTTTATPIDIVLAGPGPEALFLDRRRIVEVEGVAVPVARPEDLVVMKVLAGRPKDVDDVLAILAANADLDLDVIRETLGVLERALDQSDLVPAFEALVGRVRRR
jgi:hypothetical protein